MLKKERIRINREEIGGFVCHCSYTALSNVNAFFGFSKSIFYIIAFVTVSKSHRHCIKKERLRMSADYNPLSASNSKNGIFITQE